MTHQSGRRLLTTCACWILAGCCPRPPGPDWEPAFSTSFVCRPSSFIFWHKSCSATFSPFQSTVVVTTITERVTCQSLNTQRVQVLERHVMCSAPPVSQSDCSDGTPEFVEGETTGTSCLPPTCCFSVTTLVFCRPGASFTFPKALYAKALPVFLFPLTRQPHWEQLRV